MTKSVSAVATGAHVGVIAHVTPHELRRCLSATQQANGFANRFCFFCVKRSKELPEGGSLGDTTIEALGKRVGAALVFGRSVAEMKRDDAARALWAAVYGRLINAKDGLANDLLARRAPHVMRFACMFALLDWSAVVLPVHLLAALALWDYSEQSVRHVFGDALGDAVADELLRLLRSAGDVGLTRLEIYNALGRHKSREQIGLALAALASRKLVAVEKRETGGRPEERWKVVPQPLSTLSALSTAGGSAQ
jgi:hypothetical protein